MHIQLNGERFELPDGQSVADLLQRLELTGRRLAVELNREIVPRSQHAATTLVEGDQIEVVHAIGGGCKELRSTWSSSDALVLAWSRSVRVDGNNP